MSYLRGNMNQRVQQGHCEGAGVGLSDHIHIGVGREE